MSEFESTLSTVKRSKTQKILRVLGIVALAEAILIMTVGIALALYVAFALSSAVEDIQTPDAPPTVEQQVPDGFKLCPGNPDAYQWPVSEECPS